MSNADRQKRYRDKKRNAQPVTDSNVTPERNAHGNTPLSIIDEVVTFPLQHDVPPGDAIDLLDDYKRKMGDVLQFTPRTNPDKLNWGTHMTPDELQRAGLKANRVPIPGDYDYTGVAC